MKKETNPGFEEQLRQLDEIVELLDKGEIPLEEQLKKYEYAIGLIKTLREFLYKAEQKVIDITKKGAEEE